MDPVCELVELCERDGQLVANLREQRLAGLVELGRRAPRARLGARRVAAGPCREGCVAAAAARDRRPRPGGRATRAPPPSGRVAVPAADRSRAPAGPLSLPPRPAVAGRGDRGRGSRPRGRRRRSSRRVSHQPGSTTSVRSRPAKPPAQPTTAPRPPKGLREPVASLSRTSPDRTLSSSTTRSATSPRLRRTAARPAAAATADSAVHGAERIERPLGLLRHPERDEAREDEDERPEDDEDRNQRQQPPADTRRRTHHARDEQAVDQHDRCDRGHGPDVRATFRVPTMSARRRATSEETAARRGSRRTGAPAPPDEATAPRTRNAMTTASYPAPKPAARKEEHGVDVDRAVQACHRDEDRPRQSASS